MTKDGDVSREEDRGAVEGIEEDDRGIAGSHLLHPGILFWFKKRHSTI